MFIGFPVKEAKDSLNRQKAYSFSKEAINPFKPKPQYPYSPNCSLYISFGTDKENLLHNCSFLG